MNEHEKLQRLAQMAHERGDKEVALQAMRKLKELKSPSYRSLPELVEAQKPVDKGFSSVNMVRNIPKSFKELADGTFQAVSHPVDTSQNLGSIFVGYGEKIRDAINNKIPQDNKLMDISNMMFQLYRGLANTALGKDLDATNSPNAEAFTKAMVDRWGSKENALNTLENDPVGGVLDIVSVFTGGAAIVNTAKKAISKMIPAEMPTKMYESAAKFSTTRKDSGANTKALMEERIPLTRNGSTKLKEVIISINNEIDKILTNSPNAETRIPSKFVFNRIQGLKNKLLNTVEGVKDRKIIDKIVEGYLDEIKATGQTTMTLKELHEWKKKTYGKVTDWAPGKGNKVKVKDETFKELAKGAKETIEAMEPKTRALNNRQAPLLDIREGLERAIGRIENRDLIGMGDLIKMGVGGGGGASLGTLVGASGAGGGIGTGIGALAAALGRPTVKSRIATELHHLQKGKPAIPDEILINAMMAVSPHLINQANKSQQIKLNP